MATVPTAFPGPGPGLVRLAEALEFNAPDFVDTENIYKETDENLVESLKLGADEPYEVVELIQRRRAFVEQVRHRRVHEEIRDILDEIRQIQSEIRDITDDIRNYLRNDDAGPQDLPQIIEEIRNTGDYSGRDNHLLRRLTIAEEIQAYCCIRSDLITAALTRVSMNYPLADSEERYEAYSELLGGDPAAPLPGYPETPISQDSPPDPPLGVPPRNARPVGDVSG
jgi:hypothetical protein